MPALLGPLIGFCLGVVFAWVSLGKGSVDRLATKHRGALLSAAFGSLLYAPICAYFVAFAADWSVAYWIDASRLPPVIAPLWVLLDASTPAVGFLLATSGERSKNSHFLRIGAGPALGALALLAVSYPRLGVHATYRQFHGDFGVNHVAGTPLGYALLWLLPLLLVGTAWTVHCLRPPGDGARPLKRSRPDKRRLTSSARAA